MKFAYNKKIDEKCWLRYNRFVAVHKNIWGRDPKAKGIIQISKANFDIDIGDIIKVYEKFFKIKVNIKGYIVTTPYSMINDDGVFSESKRTIFYSIYNQPIWTVMAHEIFHIFFEKYTKRNVPNYEESKEYFTVIINDIFGKNISQGYPNHQKIRKQIFKKWKSTHSIDACIALLGLTKSS
jgi:hypothetical protein